MAAGRAGTPAGRFERSGVSLPAMIRCGITGGQDMKVLPAIDLRRGACVQLAGGTVDDEDPPPRPLWSRPAIPDRRLQDAPRRGHRCRDGDRLQRRGGGEPPEAPRPCLRGGRRRPRCRRHPAAAGPRCGAGAGGDARPGGAELAGGGRLQVPGQAHARRRCAGAPGGDPRLDPHPHAGRGGAHRRRRSAAPGGHPGHRGARRGNGERDRPRADVRAGGDHPAPAPGGGRHRLGGRAAEARAGAGVSGAVLGMALYTGKLDPAAVAREFS